MVVAVSRCDRGALTPHTGTAVLTFPAFVPVFWEGIRDGVTSSCFASKRGHTIADVHYPFFTNTPNRLDILLQANNHKEQPRRPSRRNTTGFADHSCTISSLSSLRYPCLLPPKRSHRHLESINRAISPRSAIMSDALSTFLREVLRTSGGTSFSVISDNAKCMNSRGSYERERRRRCPLRSASTPLSQMSSRWGDCRIETRAAPVGVKPPSRSVHESAAIKNSATAKQKNKNRWAIGEKNNASSSKTLKRPTRKESDCSTVLEGMKRLPDELRKKNARNNGGLYGRKEANAGASLPKSLRSLPY